MMENWKIDKVETLFTLGRGRVINDEEIQNNKGNYPVYSSQTSNNGEFGRVNFYEFEGDYITWTTDGANAGKVFFREGRFNCTNVCGTLKAKDETLINTKYFSYLIDRHAYRYVAVVGNNKLMNNVMGKIKIHYPASKPEQTAIAAILSRVDDAIEATQNSIKAAEKLKKALMQNLLTGKLKPDGTWRREDEFYVDEKFGKVPKGWNIKQIKNVFEVNDESLPSQTDPNYLFRYITIESVSTEYIDFTSCPEYLFKDAPGRARRIIKNGDILISGVRPNLKAFAIYNNPDNGQWICSTGFYVLTVKANENNEFYFYQILSEIGEKQFHSWVAGSNYPAIGDRDIKLMRLYAPPFEEQNIIAEKLKIISESNKERITKIHTLQRLKKSLMQHLLTGKKRLPQEVIELLSNQEEQSNSGVE